MQKPAENVYPVHDLIRQRWSPRAFSEQEVESWKVCSLLEAARWAPSSYNEQPWRFFVGSRNTTPEALALLQSLLVPGNAWALKAPVLILSVAKLQFTLNGKPNRHAFHDVGLSMAGLVFQAEALGLATHQMAGFDADKAVTALHIPEGYAPVAMNAVGYPGSPDSLEGPLKENELAPRSRKPLQELVFTTAWGNRYPVCFT